MKQPQIIQLPKFLDERGNLSFYENESRIPFPIQRVHWIYDVPGGEERGGLAYKETEEFIVAMSGSFDVLVDDGKQQYIFSLNRSYMGVYIPAGTWRCIDNFSTNSVAVIAASTHYDPSDAIRSMDEFRSWVTNERMKKSFERERDKNELTSEGVKEDIRSTLNVPSGASRSPEHSTSAVHSVYDCSILELDRHHSQRKGDISVVENGETVPFDVKRVYYLYDVPGGTNRGGHAHKALQQLIIAASGSFTVTLDDGKDKRSFTLNRPYQGLLVKPGLWRTLDNFSSGAVCVVLASELYDTNDYIRDYDDFKTYRK